MSLEFDNPKGVDSSANAQPDVIDEQQRSFLLKRLEEDFSRPFEREVLKPQNELKTIGRLVDRFDENTIEGKFLLVDLLRKHNEWKKNSQRIPPYNEIVSQYAQYVNPKYPNRLDFEKREQYFLKTVERVFTAYLFSVVRTQHREAGIVHDATKEERQIQAVLALREGKHLHMGTGEGKSTVVLPIAGILEAVLSKQGDVFIGTLSNSLADDLYGNTAVLLAKIKSIEHGALKTLLDIDLQKTEDEDLETILPDELKGDMVKEALIDGHYSPETKRKAAYRLLKGRGQKSISRLDKLINGKTEKKRIKFVDEHSLVFAYSESGAEEFKAKVPKVYMDEAHGPYDSKTIYKTVNKGDYFTTKEVMHSSFVWLLFYIVSKQIQKSDFVVEHGKHFLKSDVEAILSTIYTDNWWSNLEHNNLFLDGVTVIAAEMGLKAEEKERLFKQMIQQFQINRPVFMASKLRESIWQANTKEMGLDPNRNRSPFDDPKPDFFYDTLADALHHVASMYNEVGVTYVVGADGLPLVRDKYKDEVLKGHEFEPLYQIAAAVLSNKFTYVPLLKSASETTHYQTFLADVGDQIQCISGTLLWPDPRTKKTELSSFGRFLKGISDRKIECITQPDFKEVPSPELYINEEEALKKMAEAVRVANSHNGGQPVLLLCSDLQEANALYNTLLKNGYSPGGCVMFNPIETEGKDLNDQISLCARNLGDGKTKVLISAGKFEVGVDIMNSSHSPPNLAVFRYGLPETRAKLMQGQGRRRAVGGKAGVDYRWILSESSFSRALTHYKKERPLLEHVFGWEPTEGEVRAQLETVRNNPEKLLNLVFEVMRKQERTTQEDNDFVIGYDHLFPRFEHVARLLLALGLEEGSRGDATFDDVLKRRIWEAIRKTLSFSLDKKGKVLKIEVIEELVELEKQLVKTTASLQKVGLIGLPDELYSILLRLNPHQLIKSIAPPSSQVRSVSHTLQLIMLRALRDTKEDPSPLRQTISRWLANRKETVHERETIITELVRSKVPGVEKPEDIVTLDIVGETVLTDFMRDHPEVTESNEEIIQTFEPLKANPTLGTVSIGDKRFAAEVLNLPPYLQMPPRVTLLSSSAIDSYIESLDATVVPQLFSYDGTSFLVGTPRKE